jgi:hypothetical protein
MRHVNAAFAGATSCRHALKTVAAPGDLEEDETAPRSQAGKIFSRKILSTSRRDYGLVIYHRMLREIGLMLPILCYICSINSIATHVALTQPH